MKKLIAGLLILIIGITSLSAFQIEYYVGGGTELYNSNGFVDTVLSDYTVYQTLPGSLKLNLASMNGLGSLITVNLGARYEAISNLYGLVEFKLGFIDPSTYALHAEAGALAFFPAALLIPNLHVGVGVKAGYFDFTKNLGKASVLDHAPVKIQGLDSKAIRNNYLLDFISSGISITPFADITLDLSKSFAIGVDIGYQFAIALKHALYARENKDVKMEDAITISPSEYKSYYYDLEEFEASAPSDRSFVRETDLDPMVSLTGLTVNAYVMFRY